MAISEGLKIGHSHLLFLKIAQQFQLEWGVNEAMSSLEQGCDVNNSAEQFW